MSTSFSNAASCAELDRTLSLESCDEFERAHALAHAADCVVCGPALEALSSVTETLRGVEPRPPVRAERARIWQRVAERQRARRTASWFAVSGVALAAAAAAVVLTVRTPEAQRGPLVMGELTPIESPVAAHPAEAVAASSSEAPRAMLVSRWVRAPRAVSADLGLARLRVDAGAVLALEPRAPGELDLRLYRGRASLEVEKLAPSESFEVTTPLARVKVVGTRFRVESREDVTHVEVEEGTVWVWETGADAAKVVQAGESLDVRAPATPRQVLTEARALLDSDASGAARMAGSLVDRGASPEVEVEAILVLADAERRRGDPAHAADLYRRVAEHAHGGPYVEEALYNCATLLGASGDTAGALEVLADVEGRVGMGAIGPERASLEAELYLSAGDRGRARAALERATDRARAVGDEASARVFAARRATLGN